ncbi:8679_t:CDS:2 [Funneliformis geosporum]|uniref:14158_t:CDS:1 n=1 Tax=Funneliformis geosporum TaxID=1117311 RepID=A0A9W4SIQ6_9GLOM|nr:14158_t:CDS:2 [Funneliformis geosporum]CAI2172541.1 8679_t:CDS:2 [Funneliformis geosporum]
MNIEPFVLSVILIVVLPTIVILSPESLHFPVAFVSIYFPTILYVTLKYVYNLSSRDTDIKRNSDSDQTHEKNEEYNKVIRPYDDLNDKDEKSYPGPIDTQKPVTTKLKIQEGLLCEKKIPIENYDTLVQEIHDKIIALSINSSE